MNFQNLVVLITGGTSGIGLATAIQFAKQGATVIVCGRYPAKWTPISGLSIGYKQCDVRIESQVKELIQYTLQLYGRIDIFFNNAGVYPKTTGIPSELNYESFMSNNMLIYKLGPEYLLGQQSHLSDVPESPMATIFMGTLYCLKWELIYAQQVTHPITIVNTASQAASMGFPEHPIYAASKAGVLSMTKSFAKAVASTGRIRINCVSPGPIDTPLLGESDKNELIKYVPMGRLGLPDEVARLVLFLSDPNSTYITGANYSVDGGGSA